MGKVDINFKLINDIPRIDKSWYEDMLHEFKKNFEFDTTIWHGTKYTSYNILLNQSYRQIILKIGAISQEFHKIEKCLNNYKNIDNSIEKSINFNNSSEEKKSIDN